MFVGKVLLFIAIAVQLATAFLPEKVSGIESRTKGQTARRWLWGGRAPAPPPSPALQFFAGNRRPEGLPDIARGREIQQHLTGDPIGVPPYFVSLFDPTENTAFYSAYKVTPAQALKLQTWKRGDVSDNWRTPGVPSLDKAYKDAISLTTPQSLSRGHMNPVVVNTFDKSFMRATFTLSNAVPQFEISNGKHWQNFETRIRNYARDICGPRGGTLYLLTGKSRFGLTIGAGNLPVQDTTIPLPFTTDTFSGVRLVTPRAIWTAGCCVWAEPGKVFGMKWPSRRAQSFAVMSNNQQDESLLHQKEMSVSALERLLREPLPSREVNLFPGDGNCRNAANNKVLDP